MAEIKVILTDINGAETEAENIESIELMRDSSAPCDALRLTFFSETPMEETEKAEVEINGEKVFFGYCDSQRETLDKNGMKCFIYARSSACLLLDNEAFPQSYFKPTASALYAVNARRFGFINLLPENSSEFEYSVFKGASCYGAINDFVSASSGKNICVTPYNELCVPEGKPFSLNKEDVISERRIISRGEGISEIGYKLKGNEKYIRHIKSRFLENKKIRRSRLRNISAMPEWQRENSLVNSLRNACENYYSYEIELEGFHPLGLYDKAEYISEKFGNLSGCFVSSVNLMQNKNIKKTRLTLNRRIEPEAVRYVAE